MHRGTPHRQGVSSEMAEVAGSLNDVQVLRLCGFLEASDYQDMDPQEVQPDKELAQKLFLVQANIMGHRLVGHLLYMFSLPVKFAQLLSKDSGTVAAGLGDLRKWFGILQDLESIAHTDAELSEMHIALVWPSLHWVRMILLGLAESKFGQVPEWVKSKLLNLFRGFASTKCIEDMIRDLRRAEGFMNDNKDLSRERRWYTVAQSRVLKECDRRPLHITPVVVKSARATAPLTSIYDPEASAMSLGEQVMQQMSTGKFKSQSPQLSNAVPLLWSAMLKFGCDADVLKLLWLSALAHPGWVLQHLATKCVGVVLFSCQFGLLLYCMEMVEVNGRKLWRMAIREESLWTAQHIHNLDEWEALDTVVVAPGESMLEFLASDGAEADPALWVEEVGRRSLLQKSAMNAFMPLQVVAMKKMMRHLGVMKGGRMPTTEKSLATALLFHVFPKLSEKEVHDILALRFSPEVLDKDSLLADKDNLEAAKELFESVDFKKVAQSMKPRSAATASTDHAENVAPEEARKPGEEEAVAEVEAPKVQAKTPGAASNLQRMPLARKPDFGYTVPEIRSLMPPIPGIRISKSSRWDSRWRASYPSDPPVSTSATFGGCRSEQEAVAAVCSFVWTTHCLAHPEAVCPYDFSLGDFGVPA